MRKEFSRELYLLHTPEQNGVLQGRTELHEAAMKNDEWLKHFLRIWTNTVRIACYTQNISIIVKRHDKTPYEIFRERIPDISYFHVFGCPVFILNTRSYNQVPEVIALNEPNIPHTEDTKGPPDLINTEGTHEQNGRIVGIKSFLMLFGVTAALIDVNAAQSKLVLLENFNENYSKCLRLLYKVNAAEGVNVASEEVSTTELLSTAYVICMRYFEDMDQDSAHMVAASKVPMLKSGNVQTLPKTKVVEGVTTVMPITSAEDKAQRRLEVKDRTVEKRFGGIAASKKTQRNLLKQQYENFTTSSSEMLDQTFDRL
ncbi:hypothetical protein Tco_0513598 [Tanacetum coccineum]